MAKVKAVVQRSVIDGKVHGETIEVDEQVAKRYEAAGYLKVIKETPKPKSPAKKKPAKAKEPTTKS